MHLAVLMTNTDESDFAQRHPEDGEKFTALINGVRPNWDVISFSVKDGEFPQNLGGFDGYVITGSPASVHDGTAWIDRLLDTIRDIHAAGIPLFGACFGHQAIAVALGGKVGPNPDGWIFGLTEVEVTHSTPWGAPLAPRLRQYAAHIEQVTQLPERATRVLGSPACPIGGFVIGSQVYTTQNHPEMTEDFITALIDELRPKMGPAVSETARASLTMPADNTAYAETIARFFEAPR